MLKYKLYKYREEEKFKSLLSKKMYTNLMYLYGHDTVLQLLDEFEKEEKYEECALILSSILQHNIYAKDDLKTIID